MGGLGSWSYQNARLAGWLRQHSKLTQEDRRIASGDNNDDDIANGGDEGLGRLRRFFRKKTTTPNPNEQKCRSFCGAIFDDEPKKETICVNECTPDYGLFASNMGKIKI